MTCFTHATISPDDVLAGDTHEFVIRLIIGDAYPKTASRIILDFQGLIGTSRPAMLHQEMDGYIEAYVSNPAVTYTERLWNLEKDTFAEHGNESKGGGMNFHALRAMRQYVLDLGAGLSPGDVIEVRWGENTRGYGPGSKVTTIAPTLDAKHVIDVRVFEGHARGLPDLGRSFKGYDRPVADHEVSLTVRTRPREPKTIQVIRTARRAVVIPRDEFWNCADVPDLASIADTNAVPARTESGTFTFIDKGIAVRPKNIGIIDGPRMDNVFEGMNIYWGDVHTHSAFSNDCVEREKLLQYPADLMRFARDNAALDFYAVSDHHQPWDKERNKISRLGWERTMESLKQYDRTGEFLVFPAIEYRCKRGDTVMLFGWIPEYGEIDIPSLTRVDEFWKGFSGKDYLSIPHFHNPGSLPHGEWLSTDTRIEPVIEIFSCHGSYESDIVLEKHIPMIKSFRPDRHGRYFLKNGHHYGFVCNSDGHKGHVGTNGITAVFSKSLDKASILEAYRKRHIYGTTNARIRLVVTGNGKLMGTVMKNEPKKTIHIDVAAENKIKKIDVFRNGDPHTRLTPEGKEYQGDIVDTTGEPSNWYVRVTQIDNHIAYASPIWFE